MKLKVSDDHSFLLLTDCTENELSQLEYSFTKKVANYYIIKKKIPSWDGDVKFIDRYQRIPLGLWSEVQKLCTKFHFPLEIEGLDHIYDKYHIHEIFEEWCLEYFKDSEMTPYDYQIEAASRLIKFRNCTQEVSTSGGKTLIAFMFFKYMFSKGAIRKMLYVVPNINLVTQTEEKFYEYEEKCGKKPDWKSDCAFGGAKASDELNINITFGTYQTLCKKPLEYFAEFDVLAIDECLYPDTLITMADFSKKKISDINKGEKVWTKNEKSGLLEIKEIDFVYKNLSKKQQMFEIETEDGNILKITGNHKVLLINNTWKRVDELTTEDEILAIA